MNTAQGWAEWDKGGNGSHCGESDTCWRPWAVRRWRCGSGRT